MLSATPIQFHSTPTKNRVARCPCGGGRFSSLELLIGGAVSDNYLSLAHGPHLHDGSQ